MDFVCARLCSTGRVTVQGTVCFRFCQGSHPTEIVLFPECPSPPEVVRGNGWEVVKGSFPTEVFGPEVVIPRSFKGIHVRSELSGDNFPVGDIKDRASC